MSALQGNAAAQMNLAYLYAHGYGVEADEQEAARWREKNGDESEFGIEVVQGFAAERLMPMLRYNQNDQPYTLFADERMFAKTE